MELSDRILDFFVLQSQSRHQAKNNESHPFCYYAHAKKNRDPAIVDFVIIPGVG